MRLGEKDEKDLHEHVEGDIKCLLTLLFHCFGLGFLFDSLIT